MAEKAGESGRGVSKLPAKGGLLSRRRVIRMLGFAVAPMTLGPSFAAASSGTWNTTANNQLWSTSTGGVWLGDVVADGADNTADFSAVNITADTTVKLDSARTIGNLIFGDTTTSSAGSWILDNNGNAANILTLATTTPTITVNALGTNKTASISAQLSGTSGLTKAGAGTLILTNSNNDWSNGTTINAGILQIGNGAAAGAIGSGNVVLNTPGAVSLIVNRSDGYVLSNTISGSGRLTQAGAGTLTLSGANTYNSFTNVNTNTTLRGTDAVGTASGNQAMRSVFGTSTLLMSNNSVLEIRANGDGTTNAQNLSLVNGFQISNAVSFRIDVARESGSATNKTIAFGAITAVGGTTVNITGGAGNFDASFSSANIAGSGTGILTLSPTTADLTIAGNVTSSSTSTTPTLTLNGTASENVINGAINNSNNATAVAVVKDNTSNWTLRGASVYAGGTTINNGTLLVSNTVATTSGVGTGNVSVAGGTLGGIGFLGTSTNASNVTVSAGRINAGAVGNVGTLTVNGDVTLSSSSEFVVDIQGLAIGQYDRLVVNNVASGDTANGDVTLGNSTLTLNVSGTYLPSDIGTQWLIIDKASTGAIAGQFSAGSTITAGGLTFGIDYTGGNGNDVVLTLQSVPEPTAIGLFGLVAMSLAGHRRRISSCGTR